MIVLSTDPADRKQELEKAIKLTEQLLLSDGWALFCTWAETYRGSFESQFQAAATGDDALRLIAAVGTINSLLSKPQQWLRETKRSLDADDAYQRQLNPPLPTTGGSTPAK